MNLEKCQKWFGKRFLQANDKPLFGRTIENVRKHWNIKLANSTQRRKYLVFKPNYYSTKCFSQKSLAIEMRE